MKFKKTFAIIIFAIITLLGIAVPGIILHLSFSSKLNTSNKVDEALYNAYNSAMSRSASKKLSEYERLKLICGSWESEVEEADISEAEMSEVNAVDMARSAVAALYECGAYPYKFDSSYDNWYSWETNYYKCTEISFHTYSAYYWKVSFYRYDADEFHNIYITDDGTLFAIINNQPANSIIQNPAYSLSEYFCDAYRKYGPVTYIKNVSSDSPVTYKSIENVYPALFSASSHRLTDDALAINNVSIQTANDLKSTDISTLSESTQIYHIYEMYDDDNFILYIIPWE